MFRRKFSVLASAIGALVSINCFGLGLGEIAVKSSLGEPLVAVIPMADVAALSGENIAVALASKDDFELVGIDMASELGKLSFAVDLSSVTEPVIRVYSRQPMENPYLSVLIEVQWPSGRLVREYSLHLEQPVFLEGGAAPTSSVLAPSSGGAAPSTRRKIGLSAFQVDPQAEKDKYQAKESAIPAAPIIRPTVRSAPLPAASDVSPESGAEGQTEELPGEQATNMEGYTIQAGDTLWSIASRLPVTQNMQKRMDVIRDLNPDAFIDNDLNLIREGAELLLPMDESLFADAVVDTQESPTLPTETSQVQEPANPTATATTEGVGSAPSTSPENNSGYLSLTPVENGDGSNGSLAGRFKDSSISRGEFENSQDGIEHSLRENEELKVLVNSLQEQLNTMHDLMELQNAELQNLQTSLAQKPDLKTLEPANKNKDSSTAIYAVGFLASVAIALMFVFFRRGSPAGDRDRNTFSV